MRISEQEVLAFRIRENLFGIPIRQIDLVHAATSDEKAISVDHILGYGDGENYSAPKIIKRKKLPLLNLRVDHIAGIIPVRINQELPMPSLLTPFAKLLTGAVRMEREPFDGQLMMILDIDLWEAKHE